MYMGVILYDSLARAFQPGAPHVYGGDPER